MDRARGAGIARLIGWAHRLTLTRYLAASILSLCVDMGAFLALCALGIAPWWAAFVSYALGIIVHWLLSVRFVFAATIGAGPTRGQQVQFLLSALMGLAITVGVVALLTALGIMALAAKGAAVLVSFIAVYLVRKHVVFGSR